MLYPIRRSSSVIAEQDTLQRISFDVSSCFECIGNLLLMLAMSISLAEPETAVGVISIDVYKPVDIVAAIL